MHNHPRSPAATGADRQYEALLAAAEAERDRYQLLLEINNAVVTCLDLGSLLRATSDSLRKVIPHDSASTCNTRATLPKAHYFRWKEVPKGWPSLPDDPSL